MAGLLPASPQPEFTPASTPPRFGSSGPSPTRPTRPSVGLTLGLCLVASLATIVLLWTLSSRSPDPNATQPTLQLRTAVATRGDFIKSLRIGGTIETLRYAAIRAPKLRGPRDSGRQDLTLVKLADAGTLVEAGSVVAEFELQWLEDHIEDRMSQVTLSKSNLQKRRAEILILKETERQGRLNAQAEFEKALLDLRTAEVRSAIEAEVLKNVSEEAQATWKQLEEEGRLIESVHAADLRGFELEVAEEVLHVERHQRDYDRLQVRTPIDGMVVRETMFNRSGQFAQTKAGDQVYPGALFMRIVDVSKMVLSASVNQVDAQAIRIGSDAVVELDAYPGLQFSAHVADLAAVASTGGGRSRFWRRNTGNFIKHIPVRIPIEDEDERILPDLSASADVRLSTGQQGILVPREALRRESGEDPVDFVYVAEGGHYRRRRVVVEDTSDTMALIQSGLEPGEQVLLSRLPEAAHEQQ